MISLFLIIVFCNFMVLLVSQYSMLMLGKNDGNSILAVNFPTKYLNDLTLNTIAREYSLKCYQIFYAHLISLVLFFFARNYAMISVTMTLIYCFSVSICYMIVFDKYRKQIIKIKREQGWYFSEKHIVTVDTEVSRIKESFMFSRKWFIPPILLTIILSYVLFSNPYNVANSWTLSIGLIILLFAGFIISYEVLMRMASKVYSENTEINKALNLSFKQEWSKAFVYCSYTNILIVPILNMVNRYDDLNVFLFSTCIILLIVLPCVITILTHQKVKSERNKFVILDDEKTKYFTDDDDHYILGGFYCNPNNPSTFVEKRVLGMGLTINIATKWGKIYTVATIIMMIGLFLFCISQIPTDFWKGATITTNGDILTINAHSYTSNLDKNDIKSVQLIEELPRLTKTNGTATDKILLGKFSAQDLGEVRLFVNQEVLNYILIELIEGDYIILNSVDIETTEKYYHLLAN